MEQPLPVERHRRIRALLEEHGVVRVSRLSDLLAVSEVTIRRDLEALERRGLVERTHGGAVHTHRMGAEPRYLEAMGANAEEKRAIGRAAAALVEPGDALFLNGGTTTLEVFRALEVSGVKVITNHVGIPLEAVDKDVELILVGGHYRPPSHSLVGPFAIRNLDGVYANRAFLGVEGISPRAGVTTPSAQEAEVAQLMIRQTRGEVTLVADQSKLGTVADFVITGLDQVDRLVVDDGVSDEYLLELAEAGVQVLTAGVPSRAAQGGGNM